MGITKGVVMPVMAEFVERTTQREESWIPYIPKREEFASVSCEDIVFNQCTSASWTSTRSIDTRTSCFFVSINLL